MPSIKKSHAVNHSATNMFELVADVESYPQFVPMCSKLMIRSRQIDGGTERIVADMSVAYKFVAETFTSRVALKREALEIDVQYVDGPFKYLENSWKFHEVSENLSNIQFDIDYEFKSRALALLMGGMFDRVFGRFTSAFENRADEIYGNCPK